MCGMLWAIKLGYRANLIHKKGTWFCYKITYQIFNSYVCENNLYTDTVPIQNESMRKNSVVTFFGGWGGGPLCFKLCLVILCYFFLADFCVHFYQCCS